MVVTLYTTNPVQTDEVKKKELDLAFARLMKEIGSDQLKEDIEELGILCDGVETLILSGEDYAKEDID